MSAVLTARSPLEQIRPRRPVERRGRKVITVDGGDELSSALRDD
jgi:hypothetical protein